MIEVTIEHAHIEGEIYEPDDNPLLLEEGMLHVSVGRFSIDVSWLPEHHPGGEYRITVYEGSWENQLTSETTKDPVEVARVVEQLAEWLSKSANLPASTSSTIEFALA